VSSDLRRRPVFVTGASGFIGSNLVPALVETGAEVHALVRPSAKLDRLGDAVRDVAVHEADLRRAADVERAYRAARPGVVIHLAAPGGHPATAAQRTAMLEGTVLGTARLLAAAAAAPPERLVHVGSSLEYGRLTRPAREDDRLEPATYRGAAKAAATMLVLEYALEAARPATILRPFAVYGPRESERRLVPRAVHAALDCVELPLAVGPRHDYVYVADVVEALLLAATADLSPGEVINVASGRSTANEELVRTLARATGVEVRTRPGSFDPRPWDTDVWSADVSKAERLLGWRPAHSLDAGLQKTFEWFRSAREVPV
jgi:nucleoside-diphosphate-sugar epimerase